MPNLCPSSGSPGDEAGDLQQLSQELFVDEDDETQLSVSKVVVRAVSLRKERTEDSDEELLVDESDEDGDFKVVSQEVFVHDNNDNETQLSVSEVVVMAVSLREEQTEDSEEELVDDEIPVSRCSDQCLPGSRKKARETIHTCCYDCVPCSEGEISNITDVDNCIKCQSDEWPNEKRDRCLPKVLECISYQNDTMAYVFSSFSVFGCLVTGIIFSIFISYRDTPIVKANNRNLSYILLVSIILSFLSVFLFLGQPSDVTCRLRETSFGIFFSVAISSLLAKTIMVCAAFKSTKPGSPWRKWLTMKLPYSIVLLCSSIQVVICVIWLSVSPPFQDLDTESNPGKIIIQCNEGSDICFYSMLGYMGLLAAVSFVLAFMVRTLPDSFNEAKYITFSILLFCSVWISMIPAYLSTKGKYMVAVEIFAVMASSAGLLGCVFFPKCFIILFKSQKNIKANLLEKRKE
ncbi:vomeronasal type-2 receptor 26-like [Eleutherodactylus coqui]|uniref:vomeronasal type-2 receptor 26-like n=1 Tax=Eleutherodactylus coqui TaxID=57060 RepID=UPI0034628172